jgi:hypothetical protein
LDSGNYEASRKADESWSERKFMRAVAGVRLDAAFSFDRPNGSVNERARIEAAITAQRRLAGAIGTNAIPIVHLPKRKSGQIRHEAAPSMVARVAADCSSRFVAIPERELGSGLVARAQNVWAARQALDSLAPGIGLHLLGTGNPLSMAILATVGANSFDGLEWCRTAADDETMLLYHSQQFDFFAYQAARSDNPLVRAAASSGSADYSVRVAVHNLAVMSTWIDTIRRAHRDRTLDRLLSSMLPKGAVDHLVAAVPAAFSRTSGSAR